MKRIFGTGKKEPPPDLNTAISNVESRAESIDKKISKLDSELVKLRDQMAKMREGPTKNMLKQKALRVLKQKRMYENQKGQLDQQAFNMDQSNFALQGMKDNQVGPISCSTAACRSGLENYAEGVQEIEDLQDQMEDMLDMNNEIQEAMSRQFDTPDIDEADLEAELALLGDELDIGETDTNYLDEALTAPGVPASKPTSSKVAEGLEVDEFGLPKIPA
ncbi:unnamed protein product [Heligmosomoides polygyrus]|uniref:Charged multivesicular body protein 5 n=1 Tax=Heligmosomoides polygyrus TaxID=6339 RepID=A0A183GT07_HELPZ|nr:unnamed protein product [Heligmosomoides polygyrus]